MITYFQTLGRRCGLPVGKPDLSFLLFLCERHTVGRPRGIAFLALRELLNEPEAVRC